MNPQETAVSEISEPCINLENVNKTYSGVSAPAVKDLSLEVARGEILVLLGRRAVERARHCV